MQKPRDPWWLIVGLLGISGIGWFINTYPPNSKFLLLSLYMLIFLTCYSLFLYIFNNVRRSMVFSSGVVVFFLLRYLHLRHPVYLVLLIASIISLEVYFQKR